MRASRLLKRVKLLKAALRNRVSTRRLSQYRDDPLGYIRDVLDTTLTSGQIQVVEALLEAPHRVLCSSGHSVGKTHVAACLVNWFFDTRDPGIVLTTAPTDRQVKDLLWKEIRVLRERAGLGNFAGPKIPRLESSPDHFAHGFTAREATRFQGHHSPGGVFILFDEAEGVEQPFWTAANTMLDDNSFMLCTYNPTTPGSAAHMAEQEAEEQGKFRRIALSCLDHPNVLIESNDPLPVPGAITANQLESMLREDSLVIPPGAGEEPGDVVFRGVRYRPGPIAEARALGRRPQNAVTGVWGEELWKRVFATRIPIKPEWPVVIGCDVARYGDDHTVMVVRKGLCLVHAETHVKLSTKRTAERLRELAEHFKDEHNSPRRIPCMVDEGGVGGGVIDQADGYLFVPVNAACKPRIEARYVNVRAELWFTGREPALQGKLDISRLPLPYLNRLKQELLAAQFKIMPQHGKLQVTSKDDMKALLKRSPDLADAFNLCVYPPSVAYI